jgi:hypothetical protein
MQACSQPAIFVSSCAAVEKLKAEMGEEAAMSATVRPLSSHSDDCTGLLPDVDGYTKLDPRLLSLVTAL